MTDLKSLSDFYDSFYILMTKVATNTKLTSTKEYMQWVLLAHIYDFIDDVILQRRISPCALVFRSPREI